MNTLPSICFRKLASTTLSLVTTCNNAFLQLSLLFSEEDGIVKIPIPCYFGFRDTEHPNIEQFAQGIALYI